MLLLLLLRLLTHLLLREGAHQADSSSHACLACQGDRRLTAYSSGATGSTGAASTAARVVRDEGSSRATRPMDARGCRRRRTGKAMLLL